MNKPTSLSCLFLILVITTISVATTTTQMAQACKLKSLMTDADWGINWDNIKLDETGSVVGFETDFRNATVPCDTVGEALAAGYTIDEIKQDLLIRLPL